MTDGTHMDLSYDVRIYKIEEYKGKKKATYRARWAVAGKRFGDTFTTKKLAETFLAGLTKAAREGVPFDKRSGLPAPMARKLYTRNWFTHACQYVDAKWPHISPGHRRGISETLTQATLVLFEDERGKPSEAAIRKALHGWAFSKSARNGVPVEKAEPPEDLRPVIRWLASNTVELTAFEDAATTRRVLDALATRQNGKAVAASTITRRRATFHGAIAYAVELKLFNTNPLETVNWKAPKHDDKVDRRVLANPDQARSLLAAVGEIYPSLEAYFGCEYYAGMRPAEVRHLRRSNLLTLPEEGWGEMLLDGSTQQTGQAWSDNGEVRDERPLKHRADNSTRSVPICPELVALLTRHLEQFGTGPDGRLFVTRVGRFGRVPLKAYCNPVHPNTLTRVWAKARKKALTKEQFLSLLARRPYDLRHACLTLWLNAGVPATQVAEWAGHSVKVLLDVYAGCIDGQEEAAKPDSVDRLGS
ncbi:tyrosine-type recombinase/integrase [Kribbella sp. NPDC050820]|uniref:tyrosine-type recombinase/integrase n=1 Tax=Kribbella sp. NPDC050820 TaxID=3155408 RepID=UPI0033ED48B2